MFQRSSVTFVLLGSALLAAGCGRGTGTREADVAQTRSDVTLHVEEMTQRLRLT